MVQVATDLDVALLAAVEEILDAYGKDIEIISDNPNAGWDPTNYAIMNSAPVTRTVKATPPTPYKNGYTSMDAINVGDMQTFVSGPDVDPLVWEPRTGDVVRVPIDTNTTRLRFDTWKVRNVGPVMSGARIVLWELVLDRIGIVKPVRVLSPTPSGAVVSPPNVAVLQGI